MKSFIFATFDEPFKREDDGWGLFTRDLAKKPGLKALLAREYPAASPAPSSRMDSSLGKWEVEERESE